MNKFLWSSSTMSRRQRVVGGVKRPHPLTKVMMLLIAFAPAECFRTFLPLDRTFSGSTMIQSLGAEPRSDDDVLETLTDADTRVTRNNGEREKRKRRKHVDFPSFAYNAKRRYFSSGFRSKQQVRAYFDRPNDEYFTPSRAADVLKPSNNDPQSREKDSIYNKALRAIFGPNGFDSERVLPSAVLTRLIAERAYARAEPFAAENITVPPSLDDLRSRNREPFEGSWISIPARILSFTVSFLGFPFLTKFLYDFVTMSPEQLDEIASKFVPGISILYGTFISLTLSILYNRQKDIQDDVSQECALIVDVTRTLLSLFKDCKEKAIEAGQCTADQIRTLVRSSRGAELSVLMYTDPYARMLELVDNYEDELYQKHGGSGRSSSRIIAARDIIKDLHKIRAKRLSDESLALPPTHFLILNTLTVLILLGYTISILPTVTPETGEPTNESSLLFAVLTTTYILFYFFASDLNNPFRGVYQLRRSCAATHLLETKWLIANHPLLRGEVDFEEASGEEEGMVGSMIEIRTPGLGEYYIVRDESFYDDGT